MVQEEGEEGVWSCKGSMIREVVWKDGQSIDTILVRLVIKSDGRLKGI